MTSQQLPIPKKRAILYLFVPLAVICLIAWGALFVIQRTVVKPPKTSPTAHVGGQIPNFDLKRIDGKHSRLFDEKWKITLINFWATWCEACIEEMPSLVALHKSQNKHGLRVIGINLDEDPQKAINTTSKDFGISFENYIDPDGKISDAFDVHAIPLTVTIDENGKILELHSGDRDWMSPKYLKKIEEWMKPLPQREGTSEDQAKR